MASSRLPFYQDVIPSGSRCSGEAGSRVGHRDDASLRNVPQPVYQEDSSSALDAFRHLWRTFLAKRYHPKLDEVGTNLSYCNGEIQPASSNITLYIVGG